MSIYLLVNKRFETFLRSKRYDISYKDIHDDVGAFKM